jgi:hypothetical protein
VRRHGSEAGEALQHKEAARVLGVLVHGHGQHVGVAAAAVRRRLHPRRCAGGAQFSDTKPTSTGGRAATRFLLFLNTCKRFFYNLKKEIFVVLQNTLLQNTFCTTLSSCPVRLSVPMRFWLA